MADLSRLEFPEHEAQEVKINEMFSDEQLLAISHVDFSPWYADIINYLATGVLPLDLSFLSASLGPIFPLKEEIIFQV